ncbi:MAG: 50S ribosomal protein L22 [Candidatus Thermoplasmatota archaeon]|nr:50S ribosomal protein L22 [Candidatus Thermoplasmatota archaeon]
MRYSMEVDPDTTARSQVIEANISPKHSIEICREIKGFELQKAKDYLKDIIDMKRALPFKRFKKKVGHRKGAGFGPGRYPQKAAKVFLKALEDCESNAEYSGLNTDALYIKHIAAHRGRVYNGWMPRAHGRATDWDNRTVNIEVILEEREGDDGQ